MPKLIFRCFTNIMYKTVMGRISKVQIRIKSNHFYFWPNQIKSNHLLKIYPPNQSNQITEYFGTNQINQIKSLKKSNQSTNQSNHLFVNHFVHVNEHYNYIPIPWLQLDTIHVALNTDKPVRLLFKLARAHTKALPPMQPKPINT